MTTTTHQQGAYMGRPTATMGDASLATDHLQPRPWTDDPSETETYYFNFFVPERNLDGIAYLKIRPNLRICHSGVWIFQGIKEHHLESEHFDFQAFLPFPEIDGDEIRVPAIGLRIRIVEQMKRHEILYSDPRTGTELRLQTEAVSPAAMRGNNQHFEQVMRTTGTIRLAGEEIAVDCMQVRDRSWGEGRPEDPLDHPPTAWCTGSSADGTLAYTVIGSDDPARDPSVETFGLDPSQSFRDGWIWRDGRMRRVTSMSKATVRDATGLRPLEVSMTLTDEEGGHYEIHGEQKAGLLWSTWPNQVITFGCHFRWEMTYDGADPVELRGENQEIKWANMVKHGKANT